MSEPILCAVCGKASPTAEVHLDPWTCSQVCDRALMESIKARVAASTTLETEYTFEHLEAGACMWEHVLERIRDHKGGLNPWLE
jgi:predicted nucleic acid-binding Zn ribbon protein